MARNAARTGGARSTIPGKAEKRGTSSLPQAPSHEEIAQRAYQIFLQRGGRDGSSFDDWVEAERQLAQRTA